MYLLSQCSLLLALTLLVNGLGAQGFDPSTSIDAPSSVGHGTELEHVDLMSGAVVVRIPLLHLKGRGMDTDIVASYVSKLWSSRVYDDPYNGYYFFEDFALGTGGSAWTIGVPKMVAGATEGQPTIGDTYPNFINLEVAHLYDGSTISIASPIFGMGSAPYTGPMFSYDNSYVLMPADGSEMHFKDGKRLTFSNNAQILEDPNGNMISCTDGANCTDTLGRVISQTNTDDTSIITYPDSNGNSQKVTITYSTTPTVYPWINGQPICGLTVGQNCVFNSGGGGLISSIALPDGTSYQFQYADNGDGTTSGELTKLILPTGGYIRYSYTTQASNGTDLTKAGDRVVSQRFVSPDGTSSGEQTWTYAMPHENSPDLNDDTATVIDPLGNSHSEKFSFPILGGDAINDPGFPGISPMPISIQSKDIGSDNVLVRQVDSVPAYDSSIYAITGYQYINNPRIVQTLTTLQGSAQQALTTFSYGAYGNLASKAIYDWSGALLRTESHSYLTDQQTSYAADNVHILDLPTSDTVSGDCGTTSGDCSVTTYTYDAYNHGRLQLGLQSTNAGVVQHDYTNIGTLRGNVTQVVSGSGVNGGSATRDIAFDDLGNIVATMDSAGNTTKYDYDDNYSGAQPSAPTRGFVTKVTKPATLGMMHVERGSYYLGSGLLAAYCGENFPGSSGCTPQLGPSLPDYSWWSYDGLNRTTKLTLADGGYTSMSYPDSTHIQVANAIGYGATHTYDGLGRFISKEVTSISPHVRIETNYDQAGRVYSQTNPFFVGQPSSTDGTTVFRYDGIGRKTSATEPGASYVRWSYIGPSTASTDEAGISWTRTSDALGRLTTVVEPGVLTTTYTYDTLGNLKCVDQWGASATGAACNGSVKRSFSYDSLSKLLTSTNPETGTIVYNYDANGNLITKTDARGVVTTYSYDGLNRLTFKHYSDGTPTVALGYDGKDANGNPTGSANSIGRLAQSSNTINVATNYSYDPMGRVNHARYCVPSNCSFGIQAGAGYDLAGNMTSLTYPDGRTVSQGFDNAGRITSVGYLGWNGNSHATPYLSVPSSNGYDPAGHLIGATMGNGIGMASGYDNRQRIGFLAYGTSAQLLWGKQYQWSPNGNLQTMTDAFTGVQRQFGYDNLNRLTSAQDIVGSAQGVNTSPFSTGSGSSTGTPTGNTSSSGAVPFWTDPNDSNVLINPDFPGGNGWYGGNFNIGSGVAAPDGTMSASNLTATTGSSDTYLVNNASQPYLYSGTTMTASVWMRAPNGAQSVNIFLIYQGSTGWAGASKQVSVTTSWQQFQVSGQTQGALTALQLQIGGGGTISNGQTISIWNPMMEDSGKTGATITNFLPYSQRLTASSWTMSGASASDNSAVAPDGTNTAATITSGSGDNYFVDAIPNPAPFSGFPVTGSIWLRAPNGSQNILLTLIDVGANGWSALGASTVSLTNTWQRFQVSGTNQNTLSQLLLQIGGASTFVNGQSVQAWGAQMELASTAGPYVATGATPVSSGTNLTNILPYSQQPNAPSWGQTYQMTGIVNAVTAPDGSQTGYEATANGGNGWLTNDVPYPALYNSATVTGSVFLRSPNGPETVNVYLIGQNASGRVLVQQISAQLSVAWQRFTATGQAPNGMNRLFIQIGDNYSAGEKVDVWGAQLELASAAGPYVATSALPVLTGKELTNLLPHSQQLSGPNWGVANGSSSVNSAIAPDGTTTAATVSANSGTDAYVVNNVPNPSLYDQQTVTGSVFLRVPNGTLNLNLYIGNVGDAGFSTPGNVSLTLTTTWQRFSVTGTNQNGLSQLWLQIGGAGLFTSGQIQVWGPQMVIGTSPASYTPTVTTVISTVTSQPASLVANGLNQAYNYDSFGNILQNGSFNNTYTANNQLFGYSYDAAGNLLSMGSAYNAVSMTWDAENRISSANGAVYVYDAEGNRVQKKGVGVTDTIYFGGRPIARASAGGWTDLIYRLTGLLAEVPGTENADPVYHLTDHLGTQVGNVAGNGILANPLDYTPYGQIFSGSTSDPYFFTGKERDAESGLDYFGARYYASSMGRWMSPDWADKPEAVPYSDLSNPQSLNLYGYVNNNPLSKADPDGHWPDPVLVGAGAAGGTITLADVFGAARIGAIAGPEGALALGGAALGAWISANGGGNAYPSYYHGELDSSLMMSSSNTGNTPSSSGPSSSQPGASSSGPEGPYKNSPDNNERMKAGKAPVGNDGKPVELHHEGQDPKGPIKEMTQTDHRGGDNFKKNHENTGQQPSKIDRNQFKQDRQQYWKDKANQ